jgi:hypothetical protein
MKKYIILALGIFLMTPSMYSQTAVQRWTEDFDGNVTFNASPPGSWVFDTTHYLPGSSTTNPRSYWGLVPKYVGDTVILETPEYNCTSYTNVIMRFSHICKVSPLDIVRIEYRTNMGMVMGAWGDSIPIDTYMGSAGNFRTRGFNAASYSEWKADDSTVLPSQSWWKEEIFDLGYYAQSSRVQFRFIIIHGQQPGTQASYGWLIDNFELLAATHELYPPLVAFISPFAKDTVYNTGPWTINARVKTQTNVGIVRPWLKYTATNNGTVLKEDSILMDNVKGDSLWKATIPQFVAGTEVVYSITGQDSSGNYATATSGYYIKRFCELSWGGGGDGYITTPPTNNGAGGVAFDMEATSKTVTITGFETSFNLTGTTTVHMYYRTTGTACANASLSAGWILIGQETVAVTASGYTNNIYVPLTNPVTIPAGQSYGFYFVTLTSPSMNYTTGASTCGATTVATNSDLTIMGGHGLNAAGLPGSAGLFTERNFGGTIYYTTGSGNCVDYSNSAITYSVDIPDTVVVSPTTILPIIATVKNVGELDLSSAIVSYSVNGSTPVSKTLSFNPALPWDINHQDTIGTYSPKVNGFDTIVVWVKMPNGVTDSTDNDDTLTKIIYGSSDIVMTFVETPKDTVYNTGPFEITAKVYNISGASVGQVSLLLTSVESGTTSYDTLPMVQTGTNLWTAFTPQKIFGTDVTYAIKMDDILGNHVEIEDSYFIKRLTGGAATGYVIIGTGTTTDYLTPMNMWYQDSWTRQLYLGTEFTPNGGGGVITKLAWDYASTNGYSWNYTNQSCYFRVVDDVSITSTTYEDPIAAGGVLVWSGQIGASAPGWVEITLDQSFLLPPGKNLLIYWHHGNGSYYGTDYVWNHTPTATNRAVYAYCDCGVNVIPITNTGTLTANRPNARFYMFGSNDLDNSVALVSIDSPENGGALVGNTPTPVTVTIRNKGMNTLDSCIVEWTLNGQLQSSVMYYGELPEDFLDTITIGSYIPVAGKRDTIVAWVRLPNGEVDSTTFDDTLTIMPMGCASVLSGNVTVGIGGDFTTIAGALNTIRNCGVIGDITLLLKGTLNENVNLSELENYMRGYSLTITSLDGDADSAIIQPTSGVGVTLGKTRNLVLKNITVNAATSGTYAIQFADACTNIVIRECKLLANPTSTSSSYAPIYKGSSSTGILDSIFIINNLLDGGYYGIYFYYLYPSAATQSASKSWVRITGNTIENSYYYGIYSYYYSNYDSIAYNTINTRAVASTQYGMYLYYYNRVESGIIGNKINMRGTSTSYGIYPYYLNNSGTGARIPALVANNEIRKLSSGGTFYGLTQYYSTVSYINNSVYAEGTGTNYAMYLYYSSSSYPCTIMNNLFISAGTATGNYALYCPNGVTYALPTYGMAMDYNDYYSTGTSLSNIGATLPALQAATQQDGNSVNVLPAFLNTANNLEVIDLTGLTAPVIVSQDINGVSRRNSTTMGAYELFPTKRDLMLLQLASWNNDIVKGQTVQVSVDAMNLGVPVTGATFGWSLNGVNKTALPWTATPALASFGQQTIPIGSFVATGTDTFDIVVWIETINTLQDEASWNDTVWATAFIAPLAVNSFFEVL